MFYGLLPLNQSDKLLMHKIKEADHYMVINWIFVHSELL